MKFSPPLIPARLLSRYKRFFADLELDDGNRVTAHCANTGSMLNCLEFGTRCWISQSENPKRKLKYSLELVTSRYVGLAGVNTGRANKLVGEALEDNVIVELSGYSQLRSEVRFGRENSRVDWLLSKPGEHCYVEVKNVTLANADRKARFPDTVTSRGQKHLRELASIRKSGQRAVLLFCVQLEDVKGMEIAADLDPAYAEELQRAVDSGVEVIAYQARLSPQEIKLTRSLPVSLD